MNGNDKLAASVMEPTMKLSAVSYLLRKTLGVRSFVKRGVFAWDGGEKLGDGQVCFGLCVGVGVCVWLFFVFCFLCFMFFVLRFFERCMMLDA